MVKIGTQCVHVSAARLNVGFFRHARGCYDWRVDLELGLHVEQLGNQQMRDLETKVLFIEVTFIYYMNTINDHKL